MRNLLLTAFLLVAVVDCTIIGSSVVTSVSVVTGNEETVTAASVQSPLPPPPPPPAGLKVTPVPGKVIMVLQPNVTDAGVLSVIATLKNIVEEEHQKQRTEAPPTNHSEVTKSLLTTTPPPSVTLDLDDDEAEAELSSSTLSLLSQSTGVTLFQTTTTASTVTPSDPSPATVVLTTSTIPLLEPLENDTDTSAEVHLAIHRISGALLKPGKKPGKPIENILTDVLKSMQGQRNSTVSADDPEVDSSQVAPISREPQIGLTVIGSKGHLPIFGSQSGDEFSIEMETDEEESLQSPNLPKPIPKPKPTKSPIQYLKKPSKIRNNSTTLKRPTEFYDDEIFGYDPYQTFLHGVYVAPEDENVTTPTTFDVPHHYHVANMKPPRRRPYPPPPPELRQPIRSQITVSAKRKPVPTLPDHLHRPRPSHLDYQHSVADTIDTETGLTQVKVSHPGQKFVNHKQNLEPDRLTVLPRPAVSDRDPMPIIRTTMSPIGQSSSVRPSPPTFPTTSTQRPPIFVHSPSSPPKVDHGQPIGSHVKKPLPTSSSHPSPSPVTGQVGLDLHTERPLLVKAPVGNPGLEGTITVLDKEMKAFVDICTRLALRFFTGVTNPVSQAVTGTNVVMSPFTVISSLGILFLGARESTATQLDTLLTLDDQMTFNPHLMYHNITASFLSQSNTAAAVIRLLIADKNKGAVLDFYKMRVQHFYDARVEEVDYKYAGHLATSIINQMVRAQIQRNSYEMLNGSLPLTGPLSLLTATFFDGHFSGSRDFSIDSLDFIHWTETGQRLLVNVPAVALRGPFRATYDDSLDATAVEVPYTSRDISLLLLLPGRAGGYPIGGLAGLKNRLTLEGWTGLMRTFMARETFKVVFPRFRHHSTVNLTQVTQRFGLTNMFRPDLAKFKGINGLTDLYLDQNLMHYAELSTFEKLSDTLSSPMNHKVVRPHVRGEPLSINDWIFLSRAPITHPPLPRSDMTNQKTQFPPLSYTRIRSGKNTVVAEPLPAEEKVIRFDRPFLYVLRHNPTGFLLMMGQYTEPINYS